MSITDWVPPTLYLKLKHLLRKTQFYGCYSTWQELLNHTTEYQTDILAHQGLIQPQGAPLQQWAVAVGLLMSPLSQSILDFGGGLGGLYYEMRSISPPPSQWCIVDLQPIVEYGNTNLASDGFSFHSSVDDALRGFTPDTIVSSSVLQYLSNPYDTARSLVGIGVRKIILNRTLVADQERFMVQRVPRILGNYTLPLRFLEESRLLAEFKGYRLFLSKDWGHRDGNLYGKYKHMSYIFIKDSELSDLQIPL